MFTLVSKPTRMPTAYSSSTEAPRVDCRSRTRAHPWTDDWHRVRLVRRVKDGLIQVFFDDMAHPAMVAHDRTFGHGRLGIGSFDDTGMFDDIEVRGGDTYKPAGNGR